MTVLVLLLSLGMTVIAAEENGAYTMPCGRVSFNPMMSTPSIRRFQD
ncbi:hypothetical protein [Acetohalobium arabaticum]|nr:hypothetical protein [Acetohalobium arabaticum]